MKRILNTCQRCHRGAVTPYEIQHRLNCAAFGWWEIKSVDLTALYEATPEQIAALKATMERVRAKLTSALPAASSPPRS